jgi:hypothetical protein
VRCSLQLHCISGGLQGCGCEKGLQQHDIVAQREGENFFFDEIEDGDFWFGIADHFYQLSRKMWRLVDLMDWGFYISW